MAGTEAPQSSGSSNGVPNGALKGAAPVLVPPEVGQRRAGAAAARSAARAQTMAMLDGDLDDAPATEDAAAPVAAKPEPKVDDTEDVPDDSEPVEPAKVEAVAKKPVEDPAISSSLAKVQAAEKKSRDALAKERAAFDKQRTEHDAELKELRAKVAEFDALKKTAPSDVVSAFKALNIDLEHGAKTAWNHHLAIKDPTNPQHRAVAERMQKDSKHEDELSMTKKELSELRARMDNREESEKTERQTAQYFGGMAKAIEASEATPLLKTALGKNPEGTWKKLAGIAFELNQEHGELPDADDVIATYEKRRLAELDELGIAPPTAAAATNDSATPKKNHPSADKKQPAKTLGTDLSTPIVVKPRSTKSEREHRAETLEMLESGKLE